MTNHRSIIACATLLACATAVPAADLDTVQIHGFISQGYVRTSDNGYYTPDTADGGSLEFREIALTVLAQPEERLRIGIQLMSQDMGDIYNNEVAIDWASAVWTQPFGGWEGDFKVGRIKMGHALYNDYRDLDFSRTTVFLPECVYFNSWRRLYVALDGVGVALRSPDMAAGRVELNAVYGTQQIATDDPVMAGYEGYNLTSTDFERQWAVQLAWHPVDDLQLKLSLLAIDEWDTYAQSTGADDLISDTSPFYYEWVASLEWTRGPFQLASEGIFWDSEGTSTYDDGASGTYTSAWSQTGIGGYLSLSYEVAQDWRVAVIGQAHNMVYTDQVWGDSSDQTRSCGIATSYAISDHWLVKGEFDYVNGVYFLRGVDQPVPGVFDTDEWTLLALRTTFDF